MDYLRWAERYDIFYEAAPEGELEYYLNAIQRRGGSVLELGVGTGRIAIPAAAMGHNITGVDLNQPMLDRARAKAARAPLEGNLELVQSDMAELSLDKKDFDPHHHPGAHARSANSRSTSTRNFETLRDAHGRRREIDIQSFQSVG